MYEQLKKIVASKFKVPERGDRARGPASSDLGLDSLDMVELSLVIEQELGVQVSDDELVGAETLDAAIDGAA